MACPWPRRRRRSTTRAPLTHLFPKSSDINLVDAVPELILEPPDQVVEGRHRGKTFIRSFSDMLAYMEFTTRAQDCNLPREMMSGGADTTPDLINPLLHKVN